MTKAKSEPGHTAWHNGCQAAFQGDPSSRNPHPKPDLPLHGESYPGPWVEWLRGWAWVTESCGRDSTAERAELQAHIQEGLK